MHLGVLKYKNTVFKERVSEIFYLKALLHTKIACSNQNNIKDVFLSHTRFHSHFCLCQNVLPLTQKT